MKNLVDVAVVGAGPAGMAAALNAAVRNKSVLLLGPDQSGKLMKAPKIENVLGLRGESGEALLRKFRKHLEAFDSIRFCPEMVQTIYPMGEEIGLLMPDQSMVSALSVVIATGVDFGKPIPGEAEFMGKGVGTCATCDAALYKGKKVVLVAYTPHAAEEANFIHEIAEETTLVNLTGMDLDLDEGIEEIRDKPLELIGDDRARKLIFEDQEREADGFFFMRDAVPADRLAPGIAMDGPHIKVDPQMQTSLPGIFAAGDLVGQPYQVNVAIGRGQIAGLSAAKYATKKTAEARQKEK